MVTFFFVVSRAAITYREPEALTNEHADLSKVDGTTDITLIGARWLLGGDKGRRGRVVQLSLALGRGLDAEYDTDFTSRRVVLGATHERFFKYFQHQAKACFMVGGLRFLYRPSSAEIPPDLPLHGRVRRMGLLVHIPMARHARPLLLGTVDADRSLVGLSVQR